MNGYTAFARHYDALIGNVDYAARAGYFDALISRYGKGGRILLDLACGTGSLTLELDKLGYDCIGVDGSQDMLARACSKAIEAGKQLLFLCQDMAKLDLYGTVDVTICALDSLNHITRESDLERILRRIALFTNPGGLFLFDANTPYKHRQVLGDNTFVLEQPTVYCVWQNSFNPADCVVEVDLDFFEKDGKGRYTRSRERFEERAYSVDTWTRLLEAAGFRLLDVFHEDSFLPPEETSQRLIFVAAKADQERD